MTNIFWNVCLVALTWAVAAGFNYGIISEKLRNMKEFIVDHGLRLTRLETNDSRYVPRQEYEHRHNDLMTLLRSHGIRIEKLE